MSIKTASYEAKSSRPFEAKGPITAKRARTIVETDDRVGISIARTLSNLRSPPRAASPSIRSPSLIELTDLSSDSDKLLQIKPTSLLDLPSEIFGVMVENNVLKTRDIVALKRTAKELHSRMNEEIIWQKLQKTSTQKCQDKMNTLFGNTARFLYTTHLKLHFHSQLHLQNCEREMKIAEGKMIVYSKEDQIIVKDLVTGETNILSCTPFRELAIGKGKLAVASYNEIRLFDLNNLGLLGKLKFSDEIQKMDIVNEKLILTMQHNIIRIVNMNTLLSKEIELKNPGKFCCITDNYLVFTKEEGTEYAICFYDIETGKPVKKIVSNDFLIQMKTCGNRCIGFFRDSQANDIIKIFNLEKNDIRKLEIEKDLLIEKTVDCDISENHFVVNAESTLHIFDLATGKQIGTLPKKMMRRIVAVNNHHIFTEANLAKKMAFSNGNLFVLYQGGEVIEYRFLLQEQESVLKEIAKILDQKSFDEDTPITQQKVIRDAKIANKEALDRFSRMPKDVQHAIFNKMDYKLPLPLARIAVNPKKLAAAINTYLSEKSQIEDKAATSRV